MRARERILARLRQTPVAAIAPPGEVNGINAAELNGKPPAESLPDLVHSLKANLEAAHAEVREITADAVETTLAEVCAAKNIRTLMLPPAGVELKAWAGGPTLLRFEQPIESHKDALFAAIDAGLTVADCAVADTGMLVVAASPTQPRTLSLVPPINICLIDRRRLHATLPAALRAEGWAAKMPTNLIFISGPSKTADIQQTLAYGAHGPKELIVLIIDDTRAGEPA